jgi:hypothetical protein
MSKELRTSTPGVHSGVEIRSLLSAGRRLENSALRRLEELNRLPFQVTAISPWHYRIGSLHVWIHAARWWNEATNVHGSLRTVSIQALAISEWNRQVECLISKLSGAQAYSDSSANTIGGDRKSDCGVYPQGCGSRSPKI